MEKQTSMYETTKSFMAKLYNNIKFKVHNSKKWEEKYNISNGKKIQIVVKTNSVKIGVEKIIDEYSQQVSILGDNVIVTKEKENLKNYITYYYMPSEEPLDITQILQVAYTLMNEELDYILVSKSYVEFPLVACKCIDDVLVWNEKYDNKLHLLINNGARGRLMRLPAYFVENNTINLKEIAPTINLINEYYLGIDIAEYNVSKREYNRLEGEKPLIFVVPIFLAVGGVERNTIEVMRQLQDQYEFCLITLEHHVEQQGSLHYQLKGICKYIFDLREITEHDNYLDILNELKNIFQPKLVWLCNNSPWFEQHTLQIRKIFANVAIVAQDVYDTKMGWIEYYKNDEVKQFDRYIAITKLIEETFIQKYQIPKEKIDVIYSVVDDVQIRNVKLNKLSNDQIWRQYGLDASKKHFSYVARLTEQKNPIRYLELVKCVLDKMDDEIQFIMVGDGVYKEKVDDFLEKNDLADRIVQIPYVANTPELIGSLDGLIVTSNYEGLPIVCIEAMSMGTPVFSTDTGDTKRFVEKNENGKIIDENKTDFDNFKEFYDDLELYKHNAMQHAEEILDFFSVNHVAEQYLDTFKKAIEMMER